MQFTTSLNKCSPQYERFGQSLLTSKGLAAVPSAFCYTSCPRGLSNRIHTGINSFLEGAQTWRFCPYRFDVRRDSLLGSLVVGRGVVPKPTSKARCQIEAAVFPRRFDLPTSLYDSFLCGVSYLWTSLSGRFAAAPLSN